MDLALIAVALLVFYAALIDLLRRGSRSYPTRRDVAWTAVDGILFAIAGGLLNEADGATVLGWALTCGGGFAFMVWMQRDPDKEGTAEPPITSRMGNRIAFVGGLLVVGLLLFAAVALDGWPAFSFLVVAALLVWRLGVTERRQRAG